MFSTHALLLNNAQPRPPSALTNAPVAELSDPQKPQSLQSLKPFFCELTLQDVAALQLLHVRSLAQPPAEKHQNHVLDHVDLSASSLSRLGTASDFFAARLSREEPPMSPSRIQTAAVVLRQRRSEHLERPRKRACPPSYCADRSCCIGLGEARTLLGARLRLQHRRFSTGS